ncbi:MAG: peptidoglycan DD-metalloendopeptidase family protein [Bacteroidetes bacterium]|nr:peptidoglycan DD-metalloendopeptidase family protein [Bacteroidota bacterium]
MTEFCVMVLQSIFRSFVIALCALVITSCGSSSSEQVFGPRNEVDMPVDMQFGFNMIDFEVELDTIKSGDTFGKIMLSRDADFQKVDQAARQSRSSFDLRKIQIGKPYRILKSCDSLQRPAVFIYENDFLNFTVVDLRDEVKVYEEKHAYDLVERQLSGVIEGSLYETLQRQGIDQNLSQELANIYAWNIDFFRLFEGDKFKVIAHERKLRDGTMAGIKSIKAAVFEHRGETYYAFAANVNEKTLQTEYYDENGESLRRTFLKAPLKFNAYRISSRYNLRRKIAFYGNRTRAHKGTDYAAPVGTPIIATADGEVIEATRRGGNGIYAKIRHNGTYSTQYLHMKALNVKKGQRVSQGDIIGWIGMTGNTSGPHVCYRFWKNGSQVDPLQEKLPAAEPIAKALSKSYYQYIKLPFEQLACIPYPGENDLNSKPEITINNEDAVTSK